MLDYKIIRTVIGRSYADAYRFLSDARSFSAWGGNDRGTPLIPLGDRDWLVRVDGQDFVLRHTAPNPYGILDVQAFRHGSEPGPVTAVRLYRNLEGCELGLVSFRRPGQSEEQFASDIEWLHSDLLRIKTFLERDRPLLPVLRSHITGIAIARPVEEVFRFFLDPLNYPKWALAGGGRFEHKGGRDWLMATGAGLRTVRFAEPNGYGVLDYQVSAEGEEPVHTPVRVVANGEGALLIHTLFARPGETDEMFEWTIDLVATNLMAARVLLES